MLAEKCTLTRRNNASLTWTCSILLFVMFKKFPSLPNHSIGVCIKGKSISRGVAYGLEIPAEYIFYGNEKAIQWAKKTSGGIDGNVKEKVLSSLK